MTPNHRPRRLLTAALTAALALAFAACAGYPDAATLAPMHSDFARTIEGLFRRLYFWGGLVFVVVELLLLYVVIRFRHREGSPEPRHVHGNTTLEITWTLIPAIILIIIAIPTVRAIFETQAKAKPGSLQVEVIGHQWWWEFRYPQYGIITANELYLPAGRTVNFTLHSADVIHSFWIPRLGGKRDVVTNHTNYLWFTPDSTMPASEWNGQCAEYCGASHANMRFRTFVVSPAQFEAWAKHEAGPAVYGGALDTTQGAKPAPGATSGPRGATPAPVTVARNQTAGQQAPAGAPAEVAASLPAQGYIFPASERPAFAVPSTPIPAGLTFPKGLTGDPARGLKTYSSSACIGCHTISGNPASVGTIGPNLTHIGSRSTIAAGLYPNDAEHLALWIKNARLMKPGVLMLTLGKGQVDPQTGQTVTAGGLDDQQIADIVAYLLSLK